MFTGSPEEPNLIFKKNEALSTEQKQKYRRLNQHQIKEALCNND